MDVYQNIYWDDIPDNEALIVQDMHYLHEDDILTVTESPLDGVTYITVGDYSNIRNIMLPERKVLELLGEM
ncbi:MAG: hypothetical protein GY941_22195 [Planctomycetes bacterium]|nr:hypothetical protein [Planctomycetota bacterium]